MGGWFVVQIQPQISAEIGLLFLDDSDKNSNIRYYSGEDQNRY